MSSDLPYEKILQKREGPDGSYEILVKFKDKSYRECEWIPQEEFASNKVSASFLMKGLKHLQTLPPDTSLFDPDYTIIERILKSKNQKYLIKWCKLDYEQCTWETDIEQDYIDRFKERQHLPFPRPDSHFSKPDFRDPFDIVSVPAQYKMTVEILLDNFFANTQIQLIDELKLSSKEAICYFFEILQKVFHIPGPFLIMAQSNNVQLWIDALTPHHSLQILHSYGTKDSRKLGMHYLFRKHETFGFHVMVTTQDLLCNESHFLQDINWAVIVSHFIMKKSNYNPVKTSSHLKSMKAFHKIYLFSKRLNSMAADMRRITDLFLTPLFTQHFDPTTPKIIGESLNPLVPLIEKPPPRKRQYLLECPMTKLQKDAILYLLSHYPAPTAIDKCYKCLQHPFLVGDLKPHINTKDPCSSKIETLLELLKIQKTKVLILSVYKELLDLIKEEFAPPNALYHCLTKPVRFEERPPDVCIWIDSYPSQPAIPVPTQYILQAVPFEYVFFRDLKTTLPKQLFLHASEPPLEIPFETRLKRMVYVDEYREALSIELDFDLPTTQYEFPYTITPNPEWTVPERNRVYQNFIVFGYNGLPEILKWSSVCKNEDQLRVAILFLTRKIFENVNHKKYKKPILGILNQIPDEDNILNQSCFNENTFLINLQQDAINNAATIVEVSFMRYLLNKANLETLLKGISAKHWTKEQDIQLIKNYLNFGFGRIDRFDEDPNSKILANKTVEQMNFRFFDICESLHDPEKEIYALFSDLDEYNPSPPPPKRKSQVELSLTKENKKLLLHLRNWGIDEDDSGAIDIEKTVKKIGLPDNIAKDFLDDLIAKHDEYLGDPRMRPILRRIELISTIRRLFRLVPDDFILKDLESYCIELKSMQVQPKEEIDAYKRMLEIGCENAIKEVEKNYGTGRFSFYCCHGQITDRIKGIINHYTGDDSTKYPYRLSHNDVILEPGKIITDNPMFNTKRYIFPAGFKVETKLPSLKTKGERVKWTCEIVDDGDRPLFRVQNEEDDAVYEGESLSTVFKEPNKMLYQMGLRGISAVDAFLFNSRKVQELIRQMPGAMDILHWQKEEIQKEEEEKRKEAEVNKDEEESEEEEEEEL